MSSFGSRLTPPAWLPHLHPAEPARLPLLCESRIGYQNLCQLITRFKMRERVKCEGAATFDDLQKYSAGLVCLTGGDEGPLAAALVSGGEEAGRETVERLVRIFGRDSVYIEVQRHREREEEWRNQAAIRIAKSLKLPVLATNGVRYATAYDREVLDVFTAVRHHTDLDHAGRLLALNNRRHLRPGREMAALFRDVPGAVAQTLELSARLGFQLDDLGYEFPRYPVPDGETMDSFLRKRVTEGVMRRYMLRRQKKEAVTYPHPSLEPVLKRTLGVPLFQEQLLRIAMTVANFSGAEAEELRRAVGMRRSWERMKNLEGKLRAGMTTNGLNAATQENIIQNISSFALYGFPESHAASFALIAYASAYLKVKYLAAFMRSHDFH